MFELLAGGALGVIAGCLGMGFLLWRERGKRATTEQALALAEGDLDRLRGREATLAKLVGKKEQRIHELEEQLAAVDPGRLLDDVFGLPEPPAGKTGSG